MTSPSRLSRESTTRSSTAPQKGHFMLGGTRDSGLGTRDSYGHSLPDSAARPLSAALFRAGDIAQVYRPEGEEKKAEPDQSDENEGGGPGDQGDGSGRRARHGEDVGQGDLDGDLIGAESPRSRHR